MTTTSTRERARWPKHRSVAGTDHDRRRIRDYHRALHRLRRAHPGEFAELYEEERKRANPSSPQPRVNC
jgi:hypothetical protein